MGGQTLRLVSIIRYNYQTKGIDLNARKLLLEWPIPVLSISAENDRNIIGILRVILRTALSWWPWKGLLTPFFSFFFDSLHKVQRRQLFMGTYFWGSDSSNKIVHFTLFLPVQPKRILFFNSFDFVWLHLSSSYYSSFFQFKICVYWLTISR